VRRIAGIGLACIGCFNEAGPATSIATATETGSSGGLDTSGTSGTSAPVTGDTSTGAIDTTLDPDTTTTAFACGDGEVQGDELCDDGNDMVGDGCSECRPSLTIDSFATFGSPAVALEAAASIIALPDRIVITGALGSTGTDSDAWVEAIDARGQSLGRILLDGPAHGNDAAIDLRATVDGGAYVASTVDHGAPAGLQIELTRLGDKLDVVWRAPVGPDATFDRAAGVGVVQDDAIVGGILGDDAWIGRFDVDGNLLTEQDCNCGAFGAVLDLVTADQTILAVVLQDLAPRLWAFEPETPLDGPPTWSMPLEASGLYDFSLDVGPMGDILVCGTLDDGNNDNRIWLGRFDPDGDSVWTSSYDVGDGDHACRGIRFGSIQVLFVGEIRENATQARGFVARIDPSTGELYLSSELVIEGSQDTRVLGVDTAFGVPYVVGAYAVNATDDNAFVARLVP
jgi:cysteine-rich repeat protein